MANHFVKETKGSDDFELGIQRENSLKYFLTTPDSTSIKGLVFLIPGFGEDNNSEYQKNLREFIADTYDLACVSVMYHAIQSRPANGGQLGFEDNDIELLKIKLQQYGCPVAATISENLSLLDQAIARAKAANRINLQTLYLNQYELLTSSIYPGNGEYQNFGVMQALDHLYVLADLMQQIEFNKGNIIAFGSSQGGYIANLMAKFAPNTFSAVFDNSSWASAPLSYILGRQLGVHEFLSIISLNIAVACFVISPWRLHAEETHFYSEDRKKIRSFLHNDDIASMAQAGTNKTQYRFYHSASDTIARLEEKQKMVELMKKNGFDVQMTVMGQNDIDGSFVKNLDHGMGLSLKKMFINLYPSIEKKDSQTDFEKKSEIIYTCPTMNYVFRFSSETLTPETVARQ